jgi:hypothetical protein
MTRHTIHLRAGWVTEAIGTQFCSHRSFGCPRTLDPDEQLWLVCSDFPNSAEVLLNDTILGRINPSGEMVANITELLRPRNLLSIRCVNQEPTGTVQLEVRTVA